MFRCPDEGVRPARGGRARPHDLRHGLEVQHGRDGGARRDGGLSRGLSGQLNSGSAGTNQLERFPNIIKHIFHGNKNTLNTSPTFVNNVDNDV